MDECKLIRAHICYALGLKTKFFFQICSAYQITNMPFIFAHCLATLTWSSLNFFENRVILVCQAHQCKWLVRINLFLLPFLTEFSIQWTCFSTSKLIGVQEVFIQVSPKEMIKPNYLADSCIYHSYSRIVEFPLTLLKLIESMYLA